MHCFCKNGETFELKLEGDVGAEPLWCNQCDCNLDLDEVPISQFLKEELMEWVMNYGDWINWEKDSLVPNAKAMEEVHNQSGSELLEKLKKELGGKYSVTFSPSRTVENRC